MARTDTLEHYLSDVADAIRTKKGSQGTIQASSFDTEIINLPSGGGVDWSAIGYNNEPKALIDDYNYSKDIYDNWNSAETDLTSKFANNTNLVYMPLVNVSNATIMQSMFSGCSSLKEVPLLNTSSVTDMSYIFNNCSNLKEVPLLNTSSAKTIARMFNGCSKLENVPIFNTSSLNTNSSFQNTFTSCSNLSNTSLDNILQMCINATSYNPSSASYKTLSRLGFTSSNYPATTIQALPHYQAFINAGWTIGY